MKGIITIDGPVASGKSTLARLLAKRLNFLYLDTGAMYRAVALQAQRYGVNLTEIPTLWKLCRNLDLDFRPDGEKTRLYMGEEDISMAIRTPEIDMLSSEISAVKEVRDAMTDLQRKIGRAGNLVAEGRDMGTDVFPNAEYKFFLTAPIEVRAERRYIERVNRGETVSLDDVKKGLKQRDYQDETRAIAPLRPAKDARIIDTTALRPHQVLEKILEEVSPGGR
ncbi:MAG: (d)CMP kinase [Deltaproteobacteria bacterium]|nr:(d)CMP kinase [Deltaproteobacteria bacterium]